MKDLFKAFLYTTLLFLIGIPLAIAFLLYTGFILQCLGVK